MLRVTMPDPGLSAMASGSDSGQRPPAGDGGPPRSPPSSPPGSHRGIGAPYLLAASLLIGLGSGYAIDRAAGTKPWFTLILGILFVFIGLYLAVRDALR